MRKVFCLLVVLTILLFPALTQAAPKKKSDTPTKPKSTATKPALKSDQLPGIVSLTPKPNVKGYYDPWLEAKLNAPTKQKFTLVLSPGENLKLKAQKSLLRWEFGPQKTFRPQTTYTAILKSDKVFLWNSKKVKEIKWSFKTSDKQTLAEQLEDTNFTGQNRIDVFLPHQGDDFVGSCI